MSERRTFLLVDGENIDATLGNAVLGRRPAPEERPRWDVLLAYAERTFKQPVVGLFFLNASTGQLPMPFVQALTAIGYRPVPLAGPANEKVVDVGIQRTLEAIAGRSGDVLLCSHDGDFAPQLAPLLGDERRVELACFREFASSQLTGLGLKVHDLEYDVGAFREQLPRLRIIPLAEFDPADFLGD